MTGLWIAILFLIWYLIALYLSETFGKKTGGAGVETIFFISMIFSPVVAAIVILHKKRRREPNFFQLNK